MAHEVVLAKACRCPKCGGGPVCFDQRFMRWIHRIDNNPNGPICWKSSTRPNPGHGTIEICLNGVWCLEDPDNPDSSICWVEGLIRE